MTILVKHAFTSAKGDTLDTTLVQPSNWNAGHTITMATGKVLGRTTAGTGAAEELASGALGLSILASADLAAFFAAAGFGGFTTGDVKFTLKTVADVGWIMANDGTLGDPSSGASYASTNGTALYALLWNNIADAYAPVITGRGANAAADFAAHKKITLTRMLGRALAVAGGGSGLTGRGLGEFQGEENHLLSGGEMPSHSHTIDNYVAGTLQVPKPSNKSGTYSTEGTGAPNSGAWRQDGGTDTYAPGVSFTIGANGGGAAHNNMQPSSFLNAMIKL